MNTPTPKPHSHTPTPGFAVVGLSYSHTPIPKTMYRLATLTTLALVFFLTAVPSFAQVARFEALGSLGVSGSVALEVSADGSTVVGYSAAPDGGANVAFRWKDGEMEAIDRVPERESQEHRGNAVSADGSIVVGWIVGGTNPVAWSWENGETTVIHDPERCTHSYAFGVSADGSIVVGACSSGGGQEAIRWVDGEIEGLGWLPEATAEWSSARTVSGDGSTVVGYSRNEQELRESAIRWTEEDGMVKLTEADWAVHAYGVTPDGSVIVGQSGGLFGGEVVWRWEEGAGMQQLTLPEEWSIGNAFDVSADGSIIVGSGVSETGLQHASIWTEEAGVRDLKEVLENDFGLDLTGWGDGYMFASAISDDGTVIVGFGTNPEDGLLEGWRAEAPFGVTIADEATPEALAEVLSAPSPNPVGGASTFTIAVERGQHVAVEVFDALGRRVQTVYNGALAAGMSEQLTLDASTLPAGVYIIRATGEDFAKTQRVTVVR